MQFEDFKKEVISDYKLARLSRETSLMGRREVLTGKAKFGIFGDGKEIPQLAMAKAFENGDFRSGYYRDQTFMMAIGALTIEQFFASLYAHTDAQKEPASAGRQMNGHFATHLLDENGNWKNLTQQKNSSADISPTAGQMSRLVGLAQASKLYRNEKVLKDIPNFSINGNEIAWGTIGNASTSEGVFFEAINAAGVLQIPMIISVWDDEYGISVHAKHQTTKQNISTILKGFQRTEDEKGFEILTVNGWDYPALVTTYKTAAKIARDEHVPVLIHVRELTQPQGHSTSGSHERYKSKERLTWETKQDCIVKMREWMLESNIANKEELDNIDKEAKKEVSTAKRTAWQEFLNPIKEIQKEAIELLNDLAETNNNNPFITKFNNDLAAEKIPSKTIIIKTIRKALRLAEASQTKTNLSNWLTNYIKTEQANYSSHLYSHNKPAHQIEAVKPTYDTQAKEVDARIVIRDNFDAIFNKYPEALIFGEDSGNIGDVNQGLEGLQEKYGELRVADVGIRENTIIGQGIGMALRGLRPIAEIQYLDYLLYGLQPLSDDLATLHWRTKGRQKAPMIIRTRGHRLEGIWHSGSPMGMILSTLRGVNILVPRNMTQAAGFYNTALASDEPALIIESLNGYRLKEKLPTNLGEFKTPVGQIELLREGTDITLVSYGSTLRLVTEAAKELAAIGINTSIIDVQSLLPFDINHDIVKDLAKTNRLLIIDEDVPGGASAYILQEILETQNGYQHLDSKPETLTAKAHRPAYGTDGDYFSKPATEDIYDKVLEIMQEAEPNRFN
jgi:pyruvate/2-oxoglutarate/acetoin dehydrogenase E1 component/TPP-dependent pyruvate/acetoin dehydrogenase alpha subunit